jgi:hypothetical protein
LDPNYYGYVEMGLVFVVVVLPLVWQLIVTKRSLRADREREGRAIGRE